MRQSCLMLKSCGIFLVRNIKQKSFQCDSSSQVCSRTSWTPIADGRDKEREGARMRQVIRDGQSQFFLDAWVNRSNFKQGDELG